MTLPTVICSALVFNAESASQAHREDGVGASYLGPATFGGHVVGQKYKVRHKCTILKRKIQKKFSQRGPVKMFGSFARMFPRAPLWLSTGLLLAVRLTCRALHVCVGLHSFSLYDFHQ